MLPIAHWLIRIQGIGEDMLSNTLSFINFEPLKLYWTYFLALQTTTPKIPPLRLMSRNKMRCCAMSSNYGLWWDYIAMSFGPWASALFCEYGLFWALEEIFPKSMIVLIWCRSPMKWNYVMWKFFPQQGIRK